MRVLEAAVLLTLLPAVLSVFLPADRRPRWVSFAPFAALVLALLHLLIEGFRWQMVPAYGLTALLCLLSGRTALQGPPVARARRSWWRALLRIGGALLLLLVLAVSAGLPLALPMFDVPRPSGAHAIGTTVLPLRDESRPETFTEAADDKRELLLKVWYPAVAPGAGARPEPFWGKDERQRQMLSRSLGQPAFLFSHLGRIPTHSYPQAKVAGAEAYPVLIFSHGYAQGFSGQNTVLMEELASHGYFVFSIGHPYESSSVIFPDGPAVNLSTAQVQKVGREMDATTRDLFPKINASNDPAQRRELVRRLIAGASSLTASVHLWTADTAFVLDQLERMNREPGPFQNRLNLSRVGVLGMSFGGTTAGQFCLVDARCVAGVNLDGLQYGDLLERPLPRPFLFMNSPLARRLNEPMYAKASGPAWYMVVKDSKHFDFTDFPLVAPVYKLLGALGKHPGERMVHITNAYTLAFFDQFLKNKPSPLLAGASPDYPEVEFQSKPAGASP